MTLLEAIITHLKAETERLEKANQAYRAGDADIGEVENGRLISMKDQVVASNERTIEANRELIARFEAGER